LKILFLVKRFYTNKDLLTDRFGRLFHIPKILHRKGHKCQVLALDYHTKHPTSEIIEGIAFHSIPIKNIKLPKYLREISSQLGACDRDIIFSSGDTYIGFIGLKLSRHFGCHAVFDIYDDYMLFGSSKLPFASNLLTRTVRKSDLVICASKALTTKYQQYQANSITIENGIDEQIFKQNDKATVRRKLGISVSATVIGYFGSLHSPRGTDILIQTVRALVEKGTEVILLLAGHMAEPLILEEPWIDYRGMITQKAVVDLISACDVVTLPYRQDELMRYTNACKLMEYIACERPIVVTDVADYGQYFEDHPQCVASPDSASSLMNALEFQLNKRIVLDTTSVITWEQLATDVESAMTSLVSS
jgi:glycosyltransferase involved in cell wall biosynthesis